MPLCFCDGCIGTTNIGECYQKPHVPSWEMVRFNVLNKLSTREGNCKLKYSKTYVTKFLFHTAMINGFKHYLICDILKRYSFL
jgi:hypothetical protein